MGQMKHAHTHTTGIVLICFNVRTPISIRVCWWYLVWRLTLTSVSSVFFFQSGINTVLHQYKSHDLDSPPTHSLRAALRGTGSWWPRAAKLTYLWWPGSLRMLSVSHCRFLVAKITQKPDKSVMFSLFFFFWLYYYFFLWYSLVIY